jgi:phage/plasmid-like protein (TIGR03299 family)
MSHNIEMSNGRNNIAFLGSRNDIWHKLGQEMQPGMSMDDWRHAAGLAWTAETAPAFAETDRGPVKADGWRFIVRSDTQHVLGCVSSRYQPVQPAEVLAWFEEYVSADPRFQLDVAGSLKQGEIIWATATYREPIDVAGNRHVPRLLMTTSFDSTMATINRATMTRVVCNNTLDCALADKQKSLVRTRHSTKFNAERVGRELARIADGFSAYKAMGDAMARVHLDKEHISKLFKAVLDIPFDAKAEDVSKRKLNQFDDLRRSYRQTVNEGTEPETAWAALNAVTRYVDHDRSTRGGTSETDFYCFLSGVAAVSLGWDVAGDCVANARQTVNDHTQPLWIRTRGPSTGAVHVTRSSRQAGGNSWLP